MAIDSTDSPGLLESALAFIKGETVAKSLLVAAAAKASHAETALATATAKITELETALAEAKTKADTSAATVVTVNAQLATATEQILNLKAASESAGKQASRILAQSGVTAVAQTTETARTTGGDETFPALVNAKVKAGKSKVEAIRLVMAENPKAYETYLTVGGKI